MTKPTDITAFIYDKRGRLLSMGKNSYVKTHPMQARHAHAVGESCRIYMHAEINAIARCRNITRAHRIVITRFDKSGAPVLAAPCPICQRAISFTPIRVIEHT